LVGRTVPRHYQRGLWQEDRRSNCGPGNDTAARARKVYTFQSTAITSRSSSVCEYSLMRRAPARSRPFCVRTLIMQQKPTHLSSSLARPSLRSSLSGDPRARRPSYVKTDRKDVIVAGKRRRQTSPARGRHVMSAVAAATAHGGAAATTLLAADRGWRTPVHAPATTTSVEALATHRQRADGPTVISGGSGADPPGQGRRRTRSTAARQRPQLWAAAGDDLLVSGRAGATTASAAPGATAASSARRL